MAGTVKEMSIIKQVLLLKQQGETNRGIARKLPINKGTVNGYMRVIASNGWRINDLLRKDDPELERMFQTGRTVIINGPTGTGKSYLACALGDRACREGVKTLYFTMNALIESLRLAHLEGRESNFLRKLASHGLLIIDDFGMARLEGQAQHDFEQINENSSMQVNGYHRNMHPVLGVPLQKHMLTISNLPDHTYRKTPKKIFFEKVGQRFLTNRP